MSLITIITINFNNAKGLKKTIDSVVSQNFQDFEYSVIDGCSKDESVELIKQSPRIDYWVSEKDAGIYDAMNKGIKQARGRYCLFLNSGDYLFSKSSLETVHPYLLLGVDIVYGNMKIENEDGSCTDGFMTVNVNRNHMMRDTLWHPVSFIRAELFQVCGLYDTNYRIVADYKWFLHAMFKQKVSLHHVDAFVSVFEMGGVSNSMDTISKLRAERRSAQIEVFGKNFVTLYSLKVRACWYGWRLKRIFSLK